VNRAVATQELLSFIDHLIPGSPNRGIYEQRIASWSDEAFHEYMENLASGKETLALFVPNLGEYTLEDSQLNKVAQKLNYDFFHYVYMTDPLTGQVVRSNAKHLVLRLPLRRQVQMLYKKMSVPEDDDSVDERTGQATGASKGSRISYPELQVNAAKGLDKSLAELLKYRGGDERAKNSMDRMIMQTGGASLDAISAAMPTKVKATLTLAILFKTAHLQNRL